RIEVGLRDGNGNSDASYQGGGQAGKDGLAQIGAPDLREISQGDSNDKSSLHPFAQGDDQRLQHSRGTLIENEIQFQLLFYLPRPGGSIKTAACSVSVGEMWNCIQREQTKF